MIISFSVSNFRSIKEEQTLDFIAKSSNLKTNNINYIEEKKLRILKSIVLYGANAAGKSNLIRAFFTFRRFLLNSTDLKKGDPISEKYYDPFLLDTNCRKASTTFKIVFIANDNKKYSYQVEFNYDTVISEALIVYESSQPANLFTRENGQEFVKLYDKFNDNKNVDVAVLNNNLFFTKIGNSPNKQIGDLYLYFKEIGIWNTVDRQKIYNLTEKIKGLFLKEENGIFRERLIKLINISDTKIDSIFVGSPSIETKRKIVDIIKDPEEIEKTLEKYRETFGVHKVYENKKVSGQENFEFVQRESTGTQSIFAIGGLIIHTLLKEKPGIIFFDEFDNSIHPELCRFLIELFHNPLVNKNNSQIIFATHETQLLDKDLFRKDQIWFADKNKYGESEFYSVASFDGDDTVREGTPFDKWYKLGKFGGIPHIKKTQFFAEYE